MNTGSETELLRQIVRGERPIAEIENVGIKVNRRESTYNVENPKHLRMTVSLTDLAKGLLNRQHNDLAEWAAFVLATPSIYNLDLERDPRGEVLLECLWDLSSGMPLSQQVLDLALQLAAEK